MSDGWQPAIDNLQSQINSLSSSISALSGQESSQASQLSLLTSQLVALQTEVSAIQQQVAPQQSSVGWQTNSNEASGFASNFQVSSTQTQVPVIGEGFQASAKLYESLQASVIRVYLKSPLASSLIIDLKNLSNGSSFGAFTISSGSLFGLSTGSLASNSNDQLVLLFSVSGSPETLQSVSWFIAAQ